MFFIYNYEDKLQGNLKRRPVLGGGQTSVWNIHLSVPQKKSMLHSFKIQYHSRSQGSIHKSFISVCSEGFQWWSPILCISFQLTKYVVVGI